MPEIRLNNVTKKFGSFVAIENLNLEIRDRDFITLLGPSGCGKTTTLRMIAGLETPTAGEILIDDRVVFSSENNINVNPDKRDVGFLFQNYALWPHMTVYQNISFGLENLKWAKDRIKARVEELTELLKIEEFIERYPAELSGGQQQRVAIARTLAPNPKVLLMDEPLSNLDAKLRMEMRSELKRLHSEIDSTFVYVTHDQLEAMTLATKICLLDEGILQQYSPPLEIYNYPDNLFVADFIGNPAMNFVDVRCSKVAGNRATLDFEGFQIFFESEETGKKIGSEEEYILGFRPEDIKIDEKNKITGEIYSTLPSGKETIIKVKVNGRILTLLAFGRVDFKIGERISLGFDSDTYLLFDKDSKKMITSGRIEVQ